MAVDLSMAVERDLAAVAQARRPAAGHEPRGVAAAPAGCGPSPPAGLLKDRQTQPAGLRECDVYILYRVGRQCGAG